MSRPTPTWIDREVAAADAAHAAERAARLAEGERRRRPYPEAPASCAEIVAAGLAVDVSPVARDLGPDWQGVTRWWGAPVLVSTGAAAALDGQPEGTLQKVLLGALRAVERRGFACGTMSSVHITREWNLYVHEIILAVAGVPLQMAVQGYPTTTSRQPFWVIQLCNEAALSWLPEDCRR